MSFARLARISLARRRLYRSAFDALKAFGLRVCATDSLRGRLKPKLVSLQLKSIEGPVHVRRATSDFVVIREIFEEGEYDLVRQLTLPPEPYIVDLGGNIGLGSLYFASLFPGARIVSVEPDQENGRLLRENCRRLIDAGRLQPVAAFVGATDGTAGIQRGSENYAFVKTDAPSNGEQIPCLSMPTLLQQTGFPRIDLLKCDIEGSEAELFRAAAPWINRVGSLLIEIHAPYTPEQLREDCRRAGWDFEMVAQVDRSCPMCCLRRRAG